MRTRASWVTACVALSLGSTAYAGPGIWTTGGPYGGAVQALAIDPRTPATLYAGTGAGVFRSRDSGRTWVATNAGLTSLNVVALAIGPGTPGVLATLYAGTGACGVFKSTDSGSTWTAVNSGLADLYVNALAIDPTSHATLYAATDSGVFKSTDAGATWVAASTGPEPQSSVYDVAINPVNPATLYAGTGGEGIFKSTDSGSTWTAFNTGLTDLYVDAVAIDPSRPATVYAGTWSGVFKSTDSGGTWGAINAGLTNEWINALAIDPTTPATLYAGTHDGVFRSTNAGATWNAANTGLVPYTSVFALAIDPTNPRPLYAGTLGGVFRSTDSGGTWTAANKGITSLYAQAIAIDPTAPATLYAGTWGGGVFKSTNAGATWNAANTGLGTYSSVHPLAIDPTNPATLYAGTLDTVFKSTDSGGTWASTPLGIRVSSLAIDPTNPATLYAGWRGFFAGGPIGMDGGGVFKSTDSGENWAEASTGLKGQLVQTLAIDPTNPATLYAGACYDVVYGFPQPGGGVFKSTDAGATWTAASTGLTDLCVGSLVIDPTDPGTLYAVTGGGVFKSVDGGTWTVFDTGLPIGTLVIHPTSPTTLYAATDSGVFKSTDAGATWVAVNRGLPSLGVGALALDPTGSTTLYAALGQGGVWQSTPPTESDSPTDFHTLVPCRLIDTRKAASALGGPALMAGDDRVFALFGRCGIPSTAWALSVNLTVTQPTALGHLRLHPAGLPLPPTSSINYVAGQTRANNAIAALNGLGELAVFCSQASGTAHFILDVNGYFE